MDVGVRRRCDGLRWDGDGSHSPSSFFYYSILTERWAIDWTELLIIYFATVTGTDGSDGQQMPGIAYVIGEDPR